MVAVYFPLVEKVSVFEFLFEHTAPKATAQVFQLHERLKLDYRTQTSRYENRF